jgi:transposase
MVMYPGYMAKPLVPNERSALLAPLLPPEPPRPRGGRPRVPNRATLTGLLFVLKSGIPWEMLPQEMGCGSGMTCWRRLRDWHHTGVWHQLHAMLLAKLHAADQIDWSRAVVDRRSLRAVGGGEKNRSQSYRSSEARQ